MDWRWNAYEKNSYIQKRFRSDFLISNKAKSKLVHAQKQRWGWDHFRASHDTNKLCFYTRELKFNYEIKAFFSTLAFPLTFHWASQLTDWRMLQFLVCLKGCHVFEVVPVWCQKELWYLLLLRLQKILAYMTKIWKGVECTNLNRKTTHDSDQWHGAPSGRMFYCSSPQVQSPWSKTAVASSLRHILLFFLLFTKYSHSSAFIYF